MPRPSVTFIFALGALLCAGSFALDGWVVAAIAGAHLSAGIRHAAQFFTRWGDFPPIVAVLLALLLAGWILKRRFFIRVLLAMLACAVAGGLAANVLRVLAGRTRPSAHVEAGWYGLRAHGRWIAGSYAYLSFPSAHTAVAVACVVPLWILLPARRRLLIALPATCLALCIAASRILLNAHHLSDVLVAVWMGSLIGIAVCRKFDAANPPGTKG
jgi:membrane-associated phospholipid phosphatase